jgi:ATP-dependent RNA helicase RhlE
VLSTDSTHTTGSDTKKAQSFADLGLSVDLLKAVASQNYTSPSPVQVAVIPPILKGRDLLGIAQTGSGKTAAFALPILQLLSGKEAGKNRHVKVLVLVPTRELAAQTAAVFQGLGSTQTELLKILAVHGGVSINPQMIQMQDVEILVATPGRLLELVASKAVHLSDVEILVLDEADKMLDHGFRDEMNRLFALLPKQKQTLLFSATFGLEVKDIAQALLHNPVKVEIKAPAENIDLITQIAYAVSEDRKGPLLRYLIKQNDWQAVLIFTSSVFRADSVVSKLKINGLQAMAIHGKKSQGGRTEALNRFKAGKLHVLVATDIASRGIDVLSLPVVINYELPRSPKDYIHRIGRTGRAGATGTAISLVSPEELHHFGIIQKKMGKTIALTESKDLDLQGV